MLVAGLGRARPLDPAKWKTQQPSWAECRDLLDDYISGARAYANATREMKALLDAGLHDQFAAMLDVTRDVRERCEMARKAFETHWRHHKHSRQWATEGRSTLVLRGARRADGAVRAALITQDPSPSAAGVEVVRS